MSNNKPESESSRVTSILSPYDPTEYSSPRFSANFVEQFKNHFGLQKQIIHHFEAIIVRENTSFEK